MNDVIRAARPNITSSFEKPKTKPSVWSISTTSASAPNSWDSRVASSKPPKPAPRITTRIPQTLEVQPTCASDISGGDLARSRVQE